MQQDSGDHFTIIDFLARGAAIEAARQGEPGRCFAGLAAEMQRLTAQWRALDGAGAKALDEIERQLADSFERQRQLLRLADSIAAAAQQQTCALNRGGARAWQTPRAGELCAQTDAIAARQRQLQDAIERDRERMASVLDACRNLPPAAAAAQDLDPGRRK